MAGVSRERVPGKLDWDKVPSVYDAVPSGVEQFFMPNGLLGPAVAELAKSANGQVVEESVGPLLRDGSWLELHVKYDPEAGGIIEGSQSYFGHNNGLLISTKQCRYSIEAGVVVNSLYRRFRVDGSVVQEICCNYNPANGKRLNESDKYFRTDDSPQQETYDEYDPDGQLLKSVVRTLLPDGTVYLERPLYPLPHHESQGY